jgi:hypothetical protein
MLDPNPPKDEELMLLLLFWPKGLLVVVLDPKAFPEFGELKENPLPPVLEPNALDEVLLFWPKTPARLLLLLLLLLDWPKIDPELLDPKALPDDWPNIDDVLLLLLLLPKEEPKPPLLFPNMLSV